MKSLNDALPSATALISAAARAAHALVDNSPRLLLDSDAGALCALYEPSPLDFQLAYSSEPVLAAARASTVIRSSFARRLLHDSGLKQCVYLGAGLDTSVYADTAAKVWVVDRGEVLAWREELFTDAGLTDFAVPVSADLAAPGLLGSLIGAGLDRAQPVGVIGLGLSMYLTPQQNRELLAQLAELPIGSELVFDALLSTELADEAGRAYAAAITSRSGNNEPWQSRFTPQELADGLGESGWLLQHDIAESEAAPSAFWAANPQLNPMRLVRLVHAVRR